MAQFSAYNRRTNVRKIIVDDVEFETCAAGLAAVVELLLLFSIQSNKTKQSRGHERPPGTLERTAINVRTPRYTRVSGWSRTATKRGFYHIENDHAMI